MVRPEFKRENAPIRAKIRPFLSRAGAGCAQAAVMYLAAQARVQGGLSPFAPACFAAGLARGWSGWAMLIGCGAGVIFGGAGEMDWMALFACAGVWALRLLTGLLKRAVPSLDEAEDFLSAACAGAAQLAAGLWMAGGIRYNIVSALVSAAVSALLAPSLVSAMGVRGHRKLLMPEEQLSLALLLMMLLTGLRAVPYAGRFMSLAAAVLLTLILSGAGAGMGAMAGIAAGTALTLGGSDPFVGSTLGLCGLIAGCVKGGPRVLPCAAMLLGNLLTVTWGLGYTVGAMEAPAVLAGGVLYCLIPEKRLLRLRGWIRPALPRADAEGMALRLRQKAGRRLAQIGEVFGELADGYGEKPVMPTEQVIISRVRQALCEGCEGYEGCWTGECAQAGRLMCRMAAEALSGREITPVRDLPPDLIRHCRRSGQIDRRARPVLTELAKQRRDGIRRGEARGVMGRQFREAQRLLDALATQMQSGICLNEEYAALARAALDRAGVRARDVTAMLDDRLEIVCVLRDGIWNERSARHVAMLMSDELGVPFSPVLRGGRVPGECELRLCQAPALTAAFSAACLPADGEEISGDSHLTALLPDGRMVAAISDGMGHGERAAQESRRCISLLRKFVSAGVERDAALTAVNSLMLLREGEDMFATADLCVIDLYSGEASFSKLGACRSYILGDGGMREIAGGRLPLGVLDRVEPALGRAEVHPGDMIVMISDGVADEMKEGEREALSKFLPKIRHMKPEEAARKVIGWARERKGGGERDDMTCVAVRVLARRIRVK